VALSVEMLHCQLTDQHDKAGFTGFSMAKQIPLRALSVQMPCEISHYNRGIKLIYSIYPIPNIVLFADFHLPQPSRV